MNVLSKLVKLTVIGVSNAISEIIAITILIIGKTIVLKEYLRFSRKPSVMAEADNREK